MEKPWPQNMFPHTHISPLVIKKKINCLLESCQNIFSMKSVYNLKNSLKDISMTVLFSVETLIDFNDFLNYLNNLSKTFQNNLSKHSVIK